MATTPDRMRDPKIDPMGMPRAKFEHDPENRRELVRALSYALTAFSRLMEELAIDGAFEDYYPAIVALKKRVDRLEALPGVAEALATQEETP